MNGDTPNGGIDYAAVLADLEAKKAQIESAIEAIRGLAGGGLPSAAGESAGRTKSNPATSEIALDTFFGLSIPEAAKKFLAMRKRPATTPEIVEALTRGGQQNASSENFPVTVGAIINRAYRNGAGIMRVSRGVWGLAEWYPNKPRKPQPRSDEPDLD